MEGLDGLVRQFAKVIYDFAQQLDTLFVAVSVPRWGRVCKNEIDALQSNCIKFAVLKPERTEIIPIPVAPGALDKGLEGNWGNGGRKRGTDGTFTVPVFPDPGRFGRKHGAATRSGSRGRAYRRES